VAVKTDWVIWQRFLPQLVANTALGPWLRAPHLHAFIPFHLVTNSAYVAQLGLFWQIYCPINPHSARQLQTFFQFSLALELPPSYSFACIHHWSGKNLVLVGHQPFRPLAPLPLPSLTLPQTHTPQECHLLSSAIWNLSAIRLSYGSYMPRWYPALASVAWILTDASATTPSNFSGVCMVSGPPFGHQCLLRRTTRHLCPTSSSQDILQSLSDHV